MCLAWLARSHVVYIYLFASEIFCFLIVRIKYSDLLIAAGKWFAYFNRFLFGLCYLHALWRYDIVIFKIHFLGRAWRVVFNTILLPFRGSSGKAFYMIYPIPSSPLDRVAWDSYSITPSFCPHPIFWGWRTLYPSNVHSIALQLQHLKIERVLYHHKAESVLPEHRVPAS